MEGALTIKDILNNNWNSDNTDGVTPKIEIIYEEKAVDVSLSDYVLIYENSKTESFFAIGSNEKDVTSTVSVDVRTKDESRYFKIKKEIRRIIKNNISYSDSRGNWFIIQITGENELSDKMFHLFRCVFTITLRKIE